MRFVTDFIWRSPLGLRINAQDTAGVAQTEDWVKIRGDQLAPIARALRRADHRRALGDPLLGPRLADGGRPPAGTEVFVDERFARQPPPLVVHTTGPLHPVAYARDDRGRDVTEDVPPATADIWITFGRGFYQGVARDHWVEVELGDDVPRDRPLRLVAQGWIHPTDSSINVAIGQGRQAKPQGLVLEVPSADGRWTVARPDLGFPGGKEQDDPRRSRRHLPLRAAPAVSGSARTWKFSGTRSPSPRPRPMRSLEDATARPAIGRAAAPRLLADDPGRRQLARAAALRHARGTGQRWLDLIGFYTRFGDVRELLEEGRRSLCDRQCGRRAGPPFPAPPPPPPDGWVRDFVMIGDGWNKDGDYNTAFSKTVLPLPSHPRPGYDTPPGALEDDPVYRFHPEDWREYHTRYVTPRDFQSGLRPRVADSRAAGRTIGVNADETVSAGSRSSCFFIAACSSRSGVLNNRRSTSSAACHAASRRPTP